jgi:hypothetical protein
MWLTRHKNDEHARRNVATCPLSQNKADNRPQHAIHRTPVRSLQRHTKCALPRQQKLDINKRLMQFSLFCSAGWWKIA